MRASSIALWFAAVAWPAFPQQFSPAENLAPQIPTPQSLVEQMLAAARVKPGEMVYDLGSGDGRVLITAAQKFGARAVGIELDADLCRKAEKQIRDLGLEDRVKVLHASILRTDLSSADVVTMALLTESNERMRPRLEKDLKRGARVVSSEFPIKGWKPVEVMRARIGSMEHTLYLYEIGRNK